MANSQIAFQFTMKQEDPTLSGAVTTDNNGGLVRFGLNSKDYPQTISDGYYQMTKDDALQYVQAIYSLDFWYPLHGESLDSQAIATKIVDLGFNMGTTEIVKITQRAANFVAGNDALAVDGVMGPKTLAESNALDSTKLLLAIKAYATQFYKELVTQNPQDQPYLNGWLNRVNA